jgi:hypothetical protein
MMSKEYAAESTLGVIGKEVRRLSEKLLTTYPRGQFCEATKSSLRRFLKELLLSHTYLGLIYSSIRSIHLVLPELLALQTHLLFVITLAVF